MKVPANPNGIWLRVASPERYTPAGYGTSLSNQHAVRQKSVDEDHNRGGDGSKNNTYVVHMDSFWMARRSDRVRSLLHPMPPTHVEPARPEPERAETANRSALLSSEHAWPMAAGGKRAHCGGDRRGRSFLDAPQRGTEEHTGRECRCGAGDARVEPGGK